MNELQMLHKSYELGRIAFLTGTNLMDRTAAFEELTIDAPFTHYVDCCEAYMDGWYSADLIRQETEYHIRNPQNK